MSKPGPKPLPTAVKAARGTLQPCRTVPDEPRVIVTRPPVPTGLDATERRAWDRFAADTVRLGVLSEDNLSALRDLACADVRVVRARRAAKKFGMVDIDAESGRTRRSAYALELDAARVDLGRLLNEFGLTPSSRSRVSARPQAAPAAPTEREQAKRKFFGGGAS